MTKRRLTGGLTALTLTGGLLLGATGCGGAAQAKPETSSSATPAATQSSPPTPEPSPIATLLESCLQLIPAEGDGPLGGIADFITYAASGTASIDEITVALHDFDKVMEVKKTAPAELVTQIDLWAE